MSECPGSFVWVVMLVSSKTGRVACIRSLCRLYPCPPDMRQAIRSLHCIIIWVILCAECSTTWDKVSHKKKKKKMEERHAYTTSMTIREELARMIRRKKDATHIEFR